MNIISSFLVQAWTKAQPEYYEGVLAGIPMGKFGDPEQDIGCAAVFLGVGMISFSVGPCKKNISGYS